MTQIMMATTKDVPMMVYHSSKVKGVRKDQGSILESLVPIRIPAEKGALGNLLSIVVYSINQSVGTFAKTNQWSLTWHTGDVKPQHSAGKSCRSIVPQFFWCTRTHVQVLVRMGERETHPSAGRSVRDVDLLFHRSLKGLVND